MELCNGNIGINTQTYWNGNVEWEYRDKHADLLEWECGIGVQGKTLRLTGIELCNGNKHSDLLEWEC